jgi:hypothetical protein
MTDGEETIGFLELHNRGGPYDSKISCKYGAKLTEITTRGGDSGTVREGGEKKIKCGDLGVPNQYYLRFHLNVTAGKDKEADEIFKYDENSTRTAFYECTGAVDTAKITFRGILTTP